MQVAFFINIEMIPHMMVFYQFDLKIKRIIFLYGYIHSRKAIRKQKNRINNNQNTYIIAYFVVHNQMSVKAVKPSSKGLSSE